MIDGLSAPAAPTQSPITQGVGEATLGKEEFLQLLVAQLKNQDPLNPSRPEEMAAQLAQFTSVEQLININEQMSSQSAANEAMAAALNNTAAVSVIRKSSGAWMVPSKPRIISAAVSPTRRTGTADRSSQRAVVAS